MRKPSPSRKFAHICRRSPSSEARITIPGAPLPAGAAMPGTLLTVIPSCSSASNSMLNAMSVPLGPLSSKSSPPCLATSSHRRASSRLCLPRGGRPCPLSAMRNIRCPGCVLLSSRRTRRLTAPDDEARTASAMNCAKREFRLEASPRNFLPICGETYQVSPSPFSSASS